MLALLLARFGLTGIASHIALGLFLAACAGSALLGWGVRDAFCDAAEAKAELKLAQAEVDKLGRELSGYKAGSDNAAMAVATLTDLKDKQDAKLKQIAAELEKSKAPACRPTADSIRRLLSIP